jgi:hypothetical protein
MSVTVLKIQASDTTWALKIIPKVDVFRLQQVEHVINERSILERLRNPFIIGLGLSLLSSRAHNAACV